MDERPPKFQLAALKLGEDLESFIADRRDEGHSFDTIARHIWSRTGVSVTGVTVSNWIADKAEKAS